MKIELIKLTISNFKGISALSVDFAVNGTTITGRNASGKSSIFDAFTYLLFGKDSHGASWQKFAFKPLDHEGNEIHHLTTSVEGVLLVDGQRRVLRREIAEEWAKPRGQKDEVLKGHIQSLWIDDVPCGTLREYEGVIAQWIGESAFRALTDPTYFAAQLSWQERRKMLLALVGTEVDVNDGGKFTEILDYCRGDVPGGRKRLLAQAKKDKAEIVESQTRISAWADAMPGIKSPKLIKAEIARHAEVRDRALKELTDTQAEIDRKLADIAAAGQAHADRLRAAQQVMTDAIKARDKYEGECQMAAVDSLADARRQWRALGAAVDEAREERERIANKMTSKTQEANNYTIRISELRSAVITAGECYVSLRDHKEQADVCPTCGQEIRLTDEQRAARMSDLVAKAKAIKDEMAILTDKSNKAAAELDALSAASDDAAARLSKAQSEWSKAKEPQVDREAISREISSDPNYQALATAATEAAAAYDRLLAEDAVDTTSLLERRKAVDAAIAKVNATYLDDTAQLNADLASIDEAQRLRDLSNEEQRRLSATAEDLADTERLLALLDEYNYAVVNTLTEAVDKHFSLARWRMFNYTLDGVPVEMCELTDASGVPYNSLNTARQIELGMDVIRGFATAWGCNAPIFIDNAESSLITDYQSGSQEIRLVVADCDLNVR